MGIINAQTKAELDRIRLIRNTFAHGISEISFDTPEIRNECEHIKFGAAVKAIVPALDQHFEMDSARGKFLMAARLYSVFLISRRSWEVEPDASPDKAAQ
jgi:hypothetical protein